MMGCKKRNQFMKEFDIDLENTDGCFAPGDPIAGHVVLRSTAFNAPLREPPPAGLVPFPLQLLEFISLKIRLYGSAQLKTQLRGVPNRELVYVDQEQELICKKPSSPRHVIEETEFDPERHLQSNSEKRIRFEMTLPSTLRTSVETKNASIAYALRCCLIYKNSDNETNELHFVRGITIVEKFDIGVLPPEYFHPTPHNLVKKFGLFSCTGGQIRLNFQICRAAFVCGENITIEGRMENKTDRRVDKVAAVLQQVVILHGTTMNDLNMMEVVDIHEDNLALFVDDGMSIKIDRNFAIPPLPPSTLTLEGAEPPVPPPLNARNSRNSMGSTFGSELFRRRKSLVGGSLIALNSGSGGGASSKMDQNGGPLGGGMIVDPEPPPDLATHRFLRVFYQLSVRVKTGGLFQLFSDYRVEVMEINVPIVIGSIPPKRIRHRASISEHFFGNHSSGWAASRLLPSDRIFSEDSFPDDLRGPTTVMFLQNRKERQIQLAEMFENYLCDKIDLLYTNKYPFYLNLPTSSKQSRKLSVLAMAIRAENSFSNAVNREMRESSALNPTSASLDKAEEPRSKKPSSQNNSPRPPRKKHPPQRKKHSTSSTFSHCPVEGCGGGQQQQQQQQQQQRTTSFAQVAPMPVVNKQMASVSISSTPVAAGDESSSSVKKQQKQKMAPTIVTTTTKISPPLPPSSEESSAAIDEKKKPSVPLLLGEDKKPGKPSSTAINDSTNDDETTSAEGVVKQSEVKSKRTAIGAAPSEKTTPSLDTTKKQQQKSFVVVEAEKNPLPPAATESSTIFMDSKPPQAATVETAAAAASDQKKHEKQAARSSGDHQYPPPAIYVNDVRRQSDILAAAAAPAVEGRESLLVLPTPTKKTENAADGGRPKTQQETALHEEEEHGGGGNKKEEIIPFIYEK